MATVVTQTVPDSVELETRRSIRSRAGAEDGGETGSTSGLSAGRNPSITTTSIPITNHEADTSEFDATIQASLLVDSTVPDGGYGWVVVFACGVITWWFAGTSYCWGVIQAALVEESVSSASTLAFVGSLTVTCLSLLATVSARLIRQYGARPTAIAGVLFLGGGTILSGFVAKNVVGLFMTTGVIVGIGTSFCYMVISVVPTQYFSRKRGLANGIVYSAGGLGGAVISFAMDGLIQRVGPAWMFRIIGMATIATGLPAAWLIKERTTVPPRGMIDWRLVKDGRFATLFLAGTIATFPLFVPPFFIPLYSHSLGLSSSTGAGLVATFNFSSAVGRLTSGFLSDILGPVNTLFFALLLSALSMLIMWPFSDSLGALLAFCIVNGAANGGFFAAMPTVVGSVFGSVRVTMVMSMIVTGWMGGYLMGAPIAGYLLEAYGGENSTLKAYHPAMYYAGSLALGSAGLVGILRMKLSKSLKRRL